MAMHQIQCPKCGQYYWQGQHHVCPPHIRPMVAPLQRDWRMSFLLNIGVGCAIQLAVVLLLAFQGFAFIAGGIAYLLTGGG